MKPISNVSAPTILPTPPAGKGEGQAEPSFREFLVRSIEEVNAMQQQADRTVERLALGEEVTAAEVLTAVQKADLAFRMMMQIRNKLVQAYQEVQNIRI